MVKVMMKVSENYVKNAEYVRKFYPGAVVLDVTLDGLMGYLDPCDKWGNIKFEISGKKEKGLSLSGVMEGLKVFKKKGIDDRWWKVERYLGKKRCCKSYGEMMGFYCDDEIRGFEEGVEFFREMYRKEVMERFEVVIEGLRKEERTIVLLDYQEGDERKLFNHAEILKKMIECEDMIERDRAAA